MKYSPKQRARIYRRKAIECFKRGDGFVFLGKKNINNFPEARLVNPTVTEKHETGSISNLEHSQIKIIGFLFCEQMAKEAMK